METTAGAAFVSDDPERAATLVAAGHDVVLILDPEGDGPDRRVPATAATGGRLAVLAGRPGDAGIVEVARAMAAEVFGSTPASGRSV